MARRSARVYLQEDLTDRRLPCETELSAKDAHHLSDVLRLSEGAPLDLFDSTGAQFRAQLKNHRKVLVLEKSTEKAKVSPLHATVYQSPPRAGHFDPFVKPLAELGTSALLPLVTERTIVQKDERGWRNLLSRWERLSNESAKQSGRALPMKIRQAISFSEAIQERDQFDLGLLLSPHHQENSLQSFMSIIEPILMKNQSLKIGIMIGPEGGFSEAENQLAMDSGWQPFSINPFILRSETAAVAAMAIFQFVVCSAVESELNKEEAR